jgi:elongator complex protein 3
MIAPDTSLAERHLLACSAIVREMIAAFDSPTSSSQPASINLNELRNKYCKKFQLKSVPRLVDILAAVPEEWKDQLRSALRAKPVRTASGVSGSGVGGGDQS